MLRRRLQEPASAYTFLLLDRQREGIKQIFGTDVPVANVVRGMVDVVLSRILEAQNVASPLASAEIIREIQEKLND